MVERFADRREGDSDRREGRSHSSFGVRKKGRMRKRQVHDRSTALKSSEKVLFSRSNRLLVAFVADRDLASPSALTLLLLLTQVLATRPVEL